MLQISLIKTKAKIKTKKNVPKPKYTRRTTRRLLSPHRIWLIGIFVFCILALPNLKIQAATLSNASVSLSDPRPNALSSNYTFTGSNVTTGAPGLIRCIKQYFSDTATGTTVPSGMTTTGAGVTFDTTNTNYIPTPASWTFNKTLNGTLILTNASGESPAAAASRRVVINGITNPSAADTRFYLHFNTYSNVDCATGPVDNVVVLFILTTGSTMTLTVDPTLSFTVNAVNSGQSCAGGTTTAASTSTTVPFGTVTAASNGLVCQDLQAATNSTSGYTIYARYTAAPTNALSQTIASHSGTNATPSAFSAPGIEAYGYTTNDQTLGTGTANRFYNGSAYSWAGMTTTNAELAFESTGVTTTTYRVGHQVGVALTTEPGTYTTTIIYTCTPVY